MEREFSDATTMIGGLFVDHASTPEAAEVEAKDTMERALSDDMEYWGRISSAVLADESQAERIRSTVQPEFQQFATVWARHGRSLDVIHDFAQHIKLMNERFDRRQQNKAIRAAKNRPQKIRGGRGGGGGGWTAPPRRQGGIPMEELLAEDVDVSPTFDVNATLTLLQGIDDVFLSGLDGVASVLPELSTEDQMAIAAVYDHMLHCFKHKALKTAYGYTAQDHCEPPLVYGQNVPSYFANVVNQSIYRRKQLSMAGLRNLIQYGPTIYEHLQVFQFSGNPNTYQGNVGLNLMRNVTGNVVDLDTTVLRCSCKATLNAINASNTHKKEGTYRTVEEFASSQQAQEIAIHCSIPLLQDFAKMMQLDTPQALTARCVDPAAIKRPIPQASSNTDRGTQPVWHYVNCGQNSFHCNVPNMDDVNGALLKAPFHCARIWATIMSLYQQQPEERLRRMLDFFENCVVDSCFNMKWKSIEEYDASMLHEGTIVDVLQRTQMGSQSKFTAELFDNDDAEHSNEIALMWSLVEGSVGKCVHDGRKLRPITLEDVRSWVDDPAVVI